MANYSNNNGVKAMMNVEFDGKDVRCGECGEVIGHVVTDRNEAARLERMGYVGVPVPAGAMPVVTAALEDDKRKAIIEACTKAGIKADDPVLMNILGKVEDYGHLAAPSLRRRFVANMLLSNLDYNSSVYGVGITGYIRSQGYEKSWEVIRNEVHYMAACERNHDLKALQERNAWWTTQRIVECAKHFVNQLQKHFSKLTTRRCKGIDYRKFHGIDIFVSDFSSKVVAVLWNRINDMRYAKTMQELDNILSGKKYGTNDWRALTVNKKQLKCNLPFETEISNTYMEMYKGAGAYYTMANMLLFQKNHDYRMYINGKRMSKKASEGYLNDNNAVRSANNEGYKMLGMLKEFLSSNGIDPKMQRAMWAAESRQRKANK